MKTIKILFGITLGMSVFSSSAKDGVAEVILPAGSDMKQLVVSHSAIDNLVKARRQSDLKIVYDTIPVNAGRAEFSIASDAPCRYSISLGEKNEADFYAAPGESIKVDIKSIMPLSYSVSGTVLMEDMTRLADITAPIEAQYYAIAQSGNVKEEELRPIMEAYDKAIKNFVAESPNSPAVPFAILDYEGKNFIEAYENLTPEARNSIMMPYAEQNLPKVRKQIEAQELQERMMSGTTPAPGFTLPDLEGKQVSLSDFRGKWVILDFWGSWCMWCIKGFPALKDAYKKYEGKLEVIGIDCNEPENAWRAGVEKFKLPWVNVYNGSSPTLLQQYGIQGFPTKAIINPDGKLVDVTVGEDPTFYNKLADFIGN